MSLIHWLSVMQNPNATRQKVSDKNLMWIYLNRSRAKFLWSEGLFVINSNALLTYKFIMKSEYAFASSQLTLWKWNRLLKRYNIVCWSWFISILIIIIFIFSWSNYMIFFFSLLRIAPDTVQKSQVRANIALSDGCTIKREPSVRWCPSR